MVWPNSPNHFTWGFSHDWCVTNGYLRISGEDHFSAFRPPRARERGRRLLRWALERYPALAQDHADGPKADHSIEGESTTRLEGRSTPRVQEHADGRKADPAHFIAYGVYSDTPDCAPIVGKPSPASAVCYAVGCNAWGQAAMSFAASLVPAILGYRALAPEEREGLAHMSMHRFALHPAVAGNPPTSFGPTLARL